MEPNTSTYKQMYEGSMLVTDPAHSGIEPWIEYNPTYYNENVGFEITGTHKLAQDRPTVTISIPCKTLGIDIPGTDTECVEADFCLREFKKYIDELNSGLYNRGRPDEENGKYYLCMPGGEVLKRNTSYFALCHQKDYVNGTGSSVYLLTDEICRPPVMCLCLRIQVQLPKKIYEKPFRCYAAIFPTQLTVLF